MPSQPAAAALAIAVTDASDEISVSMKRASISAAVRLRSASAPMARSISAMTTLAPSRPSRSAKAKPRPRPAPVMTIRLPENRLVIAIPCHTVNYSDAFAFGRDGVLKKIALLAVIERDRSATTGAAGKRLIGHMVIADKSNVAFQRQIDGRAQ